MAAVARATVRRRTHMNASSGLGVRPEDPTLSIVLSIVFGVSLRFRVLIASLRWASLAGGGQRAVRHADDTDAIQAGWVVDEEVLYFGEDRVVGGVPRHRETFGDAGHRQMADHDPDQAHLSPDREILARGSAAQDVSWRHTCEHSAQR